MAKIRALISKGRSNKEIIGLGFASSTVYKVRQMMGSRFGSVNLEQTALQPPTEIDQNYLPTESHSETAELRLDVDRLKDAVFAAERRFKSDAEEIRNQVAAIEIEVKAAVDAITSIEGSTKGVDEFVRNQAVQEEQRADLGEQLAELLSVVKALCTHIDCVEQIMVVSQTPEYLMLRSGEAMEVIRKLSAYLGEDAEKTRAVTAMLIEDIELTSKRRRARF